MTARSAYRLRLRPGAESFDAAWRRPYEPGIHRLAAIAFERVVWGTKRILRRGDDEEIAEHLPSDRLPMFLLQRYDSRRYGKLSGLMPVPDPAREAQAEMPGLLDALTDHPLPEKRDRFEIFYQPR